MPLCWGVATIRIGTSHRPPAKTRRGVKITSDVLVIELKPSLEETAKAARVLIKEAILKVRTRAKPSTIARRTRRSRQPGRYPEGQPGAAGSGKLLNDSGYFANRLVVAKLGDDMVVAAPVGRLEAPRSGRGARLGKLIRRVRNIANKELDLKEAARRAPNATEAELKAMVKVIRKVRRKRGRSRNRF